MIAAHVNGEPVTLDDGTTVESLVAQRVDENGGIAVAVNLHVVPRSAWAEKTIRDGDRVEILQAAQGG